MNNLWILFLVCLVALAWRWHDKPVARQPQPDPAPPTPEPVQIKPGANRALERHTEQAMLKLFIAQGAGEESRQLQDSLARAERDESCIRHAMFLMMVLFMFTLAGLGYCAILEPDVFRNPGHFIMRGLGYLGLGALLSMGAFLGYFLFHRAVVKQLRKECRRLVLALAQSKLKEPVAPDLDLHGVTPRPTGLTGASIS